MRTSMKVIAAAAAAAFWLGISPAIAGKIVKEAFGWNGQIAGFSVEGHFSYDEDKVGADGIIRNDFESFDVSFFAPDGSLLRTYVDNHINFALFNFAFNTLSRQILQDGTYNKADGFLVGEGDPAERGAGTQQELAFWTRPADDKPPHLHLDDWADDFGFPIGYSTHEDVAFLTMTTQELLESGKFIDPVYRANPASDLDDFGQRVRVPAPPTLALLLAGVVLLGHRAGVIRRAS